MFGLHDGQHSGVKMRNIEYLQTLKGSNGAPDTIRTCDPLIRSQVLYPAELRVREGRFSDARAPLQGAKRVNLGNYYFGSGK